MKYSIYINQAVLADTKLDLSDCAILDWLYHYCNSKSEKIEAKRMDGWTWISYSELIKDMPLLRIKSKGAITKRIINLKNSGFIITLLHMEKMYIKTTGKTDTLFFSTVHDGEQLPKTVHKNEQNRSPKDTDTVHQSERTSILITNKTITNKPVAKATGGEETPDFEKAEKRKNEINELVDCFSDINPSFERFFKNKTQRSSLTNLLKIHDKEKLKKVIGLLKQTNRIPYMPTITTPMQLEEKWASLEAGMIKYKAKLQELKPRGKTISA